ELLEIEHIEHGLDGSGHERALGGGSRTHTTRGSDCQGAVSRGAEWRQIAGMSYEKADVVIARGGFAGLARELPRCQGLGESFRVVVADPAIAADARPDLRASAIAAAARRMFETLGVGGGGGGGRAPV